MIKKLATFFFSKGHVICDHCFFEYKLLNDFGFFFWIAMWLTGYQFDPSTTSQLTSTRLKFSSNKLNKKTQMKTQAPFLAPLIVVIVD